ncbi:hypothetical protein RM543_14620 [Roseicyclus sp. F158]|uniref:Uncharacterized protein n=1 Tax=Tropicimonas omnivorans TaxID=3075590 RepID=A0ABU3DJM4_9RHOB|nr:hypothetical protein [Roseicyclus sp. F158]MDT0683921.1 hypothetical protein [Roseicyclus sp. F158]
MVRAAFVCVLFGLATSSGPLHALDLDCTTIGSCNDDLTCRESADPFRLRQTEDGHEFWFVDTSRFPATETVKEGLRIFTSDARPESQQRLTIAENLMASYSVVYYGYGRLYSTQTALNCRKVDP